jgi:DNA-binding SARP family transcriptional activator
LEVTRNGTRVEPTSPKQRALLIDLLLHRGESIGRDRLIDDLWGETPPSTAAGVIQNYVSQLRRVLGPDVVRTAGQGYALADDVAVDVDQFEAQLARARAAGDTGDAGVVRQATSEALALWRGEPLADVAFEPFAQAEIRRLGELRAHAIELQLEAELVAGRHTEAAARLETALNDHPLRERLWSLLMLALYGSGRQAEALRAYRRARALFADELGLEPGPDLRNLERAILEQRDDLDDLVLRISRRRRIRPAPPRTSLLGRVAEWSVIASFLDRTDEAPSGLLLLVGEPGIGKTRLLDEAHIHVHAGGGTVVAGRAFEAEQGRPYGAWVDALRNAAPPDLTPDLRTGLAPLLPELSDEPVQLDDPNRLYDAVVRILDALARRGPVVVLLDDLHWLDEHSVALLHHAIHHLADAEVSFLATARPAELADNPACARVLQTLRRDEALVEVGIGPLAAATIAELTAPIAPGADPQQIAEATNGNPLFALEMARAVARGDEPLSSRVDALIGDRLARLDDRAAALVPWIAAYGRGVPPTVLARLADRPTTDVFEALGNLERHGVVHAADDGSVDFVHDLVRSAAYKRLSTPRRSMLHARIATVLASIADPDDSVAADTARHAAAGAESAICAAACVRAARRCLRLLAYTDAEHLVALGRVHAHQLPPAERVALELDLIRVLLHPGIRLRDPGELAGDLSELCAEAQRLGLDPELSSGLSLLARAYHWGWGDIPRARALMQRAVHLIEATSEPNLEPLLEGARCLAYLEMDMDRTARLFDQLGSLDALTAHSFQYQWGAGLVHAWRGAIEPARVSLGRAVQLATARGDHWATFECTARLALLELEAGNPGVAEPLCAALRPLADKLGDGSERPYAAAIGALPAIARSEPNARTSLDEAVGSLEQIDANFLIPDVLGIAAEVEWRNANPDAGRDLADRALRCAEEVARPTEVVRAHALLAAIDAEQGRLGEARTHVDATDAGGTALPAHVEGLRRTAAWLVANRTAEKESTRGRDHGGGTVRPSDRPQSGKPGG